MVKLIMGLSGSGKTKNLVKLVLRGGYAAGDADDAPSGDKYSTIISADAGLDNVWVSFDPETAAKTVVLEDGEPTIQLVETPAS